MSALKGKDNTNSMREMCALHPHESATSSAMSINLGEAQQMADFFTTLGDATRLRILSLLADGECCVCDLAANLGMTQSAISHQLRTLRAARIVRYRKQGRQVFYRLHDHHVISLYRTVREHLAE